MNIYVRVLTERDERRISKSVFRRSLPLVVELRGRNADRVLFLFCVA